MLGYLIDRASEIADTEGLTAGLIWLGVHAWFEGGLAEIAAGTTASGSDAEDAE